MAPVPEADEDDEYLVSWDGKDDVANPMNWTLAYKSLVIAIVSYNTWVVYVPPFHQLYLADISSIYASTSFLSGMPGMKQTFHVQQDERITLGVTVYLLGLAAGCLVLAPMSEVYGRRPIFLCSMLCFTLLTLPCALANSLKDILTVRFFAYVAPRPVHSRLRYSSVGTLKFPQGHSLDLPCCQTRQELSTTLSIRNTGQPPTVAGLSALSMVQQRVQSSVASSSNTSAGAGQNGSS